jgi:putative peptidoglycan lipid II flippase
VVSTVESNNASPTVRGVGRSAFLVGAGILLSRIVGVVRLRVFSYYFGLESEAADAFNAAFRIPNILQNLFGEGVLSASFIPVYASLLARADNEEADRVAGAIASLLVLTMSLFVLVGVLATPYLIMAIAPGFEGQQRDLTIRLVRVLFPSIGLLVLSAWCLGILNSHRKFFLSYSAPVFFNVVMIATLLIFGSQRGQDRLAETLAWGSVVGSALQFGIQLPVVLTLATRLRLGLGLRSENVGAVVRNFAPVFMSRGVVQVSAYVDTVLASLLPTGAVTGLFNAQILYTLPVSLFGMSVSAAELPAMSSAMGDHQEIASQLRQRLNTGLRQIAFFIVPSSMGFLALGDVIAAALLQTGRLTHNDAVYIWGILAGSTIGLLASTLGRLYQSAYYALRDTRTPLRYAIIRVILTTVLGYAFAIHVPPLLGMNLKWGVAGLTFSAGLAGWVEFILLRRTLNRRIGRTGLAASFVIKLWAAAAAAATLGWAIKLGLAPHDPIVAAVWILGPYGVTYLAVTYLFGIPEVDGMVRRLGPYAGRRR